MPSRQVSRNALTCSGSRVMCSGSPSFTSRVAVDHWKLLFGPFHSGSIIGRTVPCRAALPLCKRCHHLQAVAEDHAIGPVGVVLIELRLSRFAREPVEIRKEIDLSFCGLGVSLGSMLQVVNQHFRLNLLLDIERRGRDNSNQSARALFLARPVAV